MQNLSTRLLLPGICFLIANLFVVCSAQAQISDRVFKSDHRIDPEKKGQLSVELDNISFFKDNEYTGSIMKGYSLPGFWIQPKAVFYPLGNIKEVRLQDQPSGSTPDYIKVRSGYD